MNIAVPVATLRVCRENVDYDWCLMWRPFKWRLFDKLRSLSVFLASDGTIDIGHNGVRRFHGIPLSII